MIKKIISITCFALTTTACFANTHSALRCNTTSKLAHTNHCAQMLYALVAENGVITQNQKSGAYYLTLAQTSKMLTYFSDRPVRISGITRLSNLIKFWNVGKDSFAKVPPNAALEAFNATSHGKMTTQHYTLELSHPALNIQKNELRFTVKPVGKTQLNKLPISLRHVALFIDPTWGGNLG